MARRGRPSKSGKRTASGRLKKNNYPDPKVVQPSAWVAGRVEEYGPYYSTALGRAFVKGLLGDHENDPRAKDRFDNATKFVRLYKRFIGGDAYRCPLNDTPRGGNVVEMVTDHQKDDHDWLFQNMKALDESGGRAYFDQLISRLHIDKGPYWVDALLAGGKHPADIAVLQAALKALDSFGAVSRRSRLGPERKIA